MAFRETLKKAAECLIGANLNKREFEVYQKQSMQERKAIVEQVASKMIEIVKGEDDQNKGKARKRLYAKDKSKYKRMIRCFLDYPLDGMNRDLIEELKSSVRSHILLKDIVEDPDYGDYFLKALQPVIKKAAGDWVQKKGTELGGKAAKWVTDKVIEGVFNLFG